MIEAFKIEHLERDHPGEQYPAVAPLLSGEAASLAQRLASLLARIYVSEPLSGIDANSEAFHLSEIWATAGIQPDCEVLLSFDFLRSIDRMLRADVERHFSNIWYPLSDDLLIFDESVSWLVFVHHDGCIQTARD